MKPIDELHMSTSHDNPGCGFRNDLARLTTDPEIVTCKRCRLSKAFGYRARKLASERSR